MFRVDAAELDAAAFPSTLFKRIRIVPDNLALILKESPALDERIAAASQHDPLKFYRDHATKYPHRNFYPRGKGMRSFCEKALDHLRRLGVNVVFGQTVESITNQGAGLKLMLSDSRRLETDRVLWATDPGPLARLLLHQDPLGELVHNVPMIVYYFKCPREQVGEYTYIHDFSENTLILRASTPGVYGQQIHADGTTYVCFEVPTKLGSPVWYNPEEYLNTVWQEALSLGVVSGEQPKEHTLLRAPVSYRVAKKGFAATQDEIFERIHDFSRGIIIAEPAAFLRADIVASLRDIPKF
jgi:protoporphyrinogen oxidase